MEHPAYAYVAYNYTSMSVWDSFSRDIEISSDAEIIPYNEFGEYGDDLYTISGFEKVKNIITERHPNRHNIVIINVILLFKESKPMLE